VIEFDIDSESAAEFVAATNTLKFAAMRDELAVEQISSPQNLASSSIAFAANVQDESAGVHGDLGTGRFILLHEVSEQEQWGGRFRIVCFVKSPLETDLGSDEMISDVSWDWLSEALSRHGAEYLNAAGTATRIISSGFGSLAGQSDHAELEMRASWSPLGGDISRHFEAWQDLVCIMSGLPSVAERIGDLRSIR